MRVLHVIPDLATGGAERMTVTLAAALRRSGIDCSVLSLYDPRGSPLEERLASAGVTLHTAGKRPGPDPVLPLTLERVIRRLEPDLLHTHRYALRYVAPALLTRPRVAAVHTVHTLVDREVPRVDHGWRRVLFRRGRVLPVAVSRAVAGSVRQRYGLSRCESVLNGVDVPEAWSGPGQADGSTRLLCVARLTQVKGHDVLLRALARTPAECVLTCAGDGPARDDLVALAERLGLSDRVRFLGEVADVASLHAQSDVLVLASAYEGAPLAVAEAMAAGLPVIATAVGGVPELVEHRQTGLLVPPGDVQGFAEAIEAARVDVQRRALWSRTARSRALSSLSAEAMRSSYERLYERAIADRRRPGGPRPARGTR